MNRKRLWSEIQPEVRRRLKNKDKSFSMTGRWKSYLYSVDGIDVYYVDNEWIRDNICPFFAHAGHGYVYSFIPFDEIWIGDVHFPGCGCKGAYPGKRMSGLFIESTILHEIHELTLMKKGMLYLPAHNMTLKKEKECGLLSDPYSD